MLSIALLGLSWRFGLIDLKETDATTYKETFSIEKNLNLELDPDGNPKRITSFNPAHVIYYSLDGGESYQTNGNNLNFFDLENMDISKVPSSIRWQVPIGEITKSNSVLVFFVHPDKKVRSNIKYFSSISNDHENLPILNLCVKENDLFGEFEGLLVQGASSWEQSEFQEPWWLRDANYTQKGMEWERHAYLQLFENGELILDQTCGLRVNGNATRGFPQKSLRLIAGPLYSDKKFRYELFGKPGIKKYESLVLRTSGNDNGKTMFADLLMQNLASECDLIILHGKPTVLYINGNYWGVYNLRERIDQYLIAKVEDVKPEQVTILENGTGELKDGLEEEQEIFLSFISKFESENTQPSYADCKDFIDMGSYMDYIFIETFYGNNDWPHNNSTCYKAGDKKWKWLLNDLDYSLAYPGENNLTLNMFERISTSNSVHVVIFNELIKDEKFKKKFIKRCTENLAVHLSEERIIAEYQKLKSEYDPEMSRQIRRWRNIESIEAWEANCEKNLNFLLKRGIIYKAHLENL